MYTRQGFVTRNVRLCLCMPLAHFQFTYWYLIVGSLLPLSRPDAARLERRDGCFRPALRFNAVRRPVYRLPPLDRFRLRLLRRAGLQPGH